MTKKERKQECEQQLEVAERLDHLDATIWDLFVEVDEESQEYAYMTTASDALPAAVMCLKKKAKTK